LFPITDYIFPVVPICKNVFPVLLLFINNGPKFVCPLTFNDDRHETLFASVVMPLTFNDELHVIGCDNLPTTTYDVEADAIPL